MTAIRKKAKIRPFRILAVCLSVIALLMAAKFPAKVVSIEEQQKELAEIAQAYYDVQAQNNQLNAELDEINTADFVERTARRDHGYCWYGETIYEVGNLSEVIQEPEFEIYDGE